MLNLREGGARHVDPPAVTGEGINKGARIPHQ